MQEAKPSIVTRFYENASRNSKIPSRITNSQAHGRPLIEQSKVKRNHQKLCRWNNENILDGLRNERIVLRLTSDTKLGHPLPPLIVRTLKERSPLQSGIDKVRVESFSNRGKHSYCGKSARTSSVSQKASHRGNRCNRLSSRLQLNDTGAAQDERYRHLQASWLQSRFVNTDWLPASEDAVIATEREHSLVVESFSI